MHHFKKTKWLNFLGKFRTISQHTGCTRSILQMVFPHIPIHYTIYSSRFWLRSVSLFSAPLHLWLCGREVLRGQWIWLLRLEAACRPCHRKWASPMGSVCHRRSNRPPGNLLVPTVSIRGFYPDQSGTAAWVLGAPTLPCFAKNKTYSGSCMQHSKADLKLIEQFEMWKFELFV